MSLQIQKELKRLRNLKQNKEKTDKELMKQAQVNLARKRFVIDDRFTNAKEKKDAQDIFDNYVAYYGFEKLTDLETLGDLAYEEILKRRIQKHLNKINENEKTTYVDKNTLDGLHNVETRILDLKVKLGIDAEDNGQDELSALQLLEKRFHNYIQENKNEFTTVCAHCGNLLLLRKRVKDFEALKHPHFFGRFWYNKEAMQLVKDGVLTKENYAKIFVTSIDYIDWCLENEDKILQ